MTKTQFIDVLNTIFVENIGFMLIFLITLVLLFYLIKVFKFALELIITENKLSIGIISQFQFIFYTFISVNILLKPFYKLVSKILYPKVDQHIFDRAIAKYDKKMESSKLLQYLNISASDFGNNIELLEMNQALFELFSKDKFVFERAINNLIYYNNEDSEIMKKILNVFIVNGTKEIKNIAIKYKIKLMQNKYIVEN